MKQKNHAITTLEVNWIVDYPEFQLIILFPEIEVLEIVSWFGQSIALGMLFVNQKPMQKKRKTEATLGCLVNSVRLKQN